MQIVIKEKQDNPCPWSVLNISGPGYFNKASSSASIQKSAARQFDNFIFKKAVSIIDGLSGDLISKFFSERRHLQGFEFRIEHSKYYEEED